MLNQLRRRAYGKDPKVPNAELDYKLSDYASMTAYMDLLLKEETYEHFNEAKHWDFIVRQGRAQELVGKYFNVETGEYTQIQERHYLWKIPDSEFNYNKAMDQVKDQNPGIPAPIKKEKDKFVTNQSRVTYARDKTNQIYYEQKQIFKDIIRSLHLHSLNLLRTKKRTETITSTLLEYTKRYVVWTR